ncbi:GTR2 [Sanghuangporus sanghuang]
MSTKVVAAASAQGTGTARPTLAQQVNSSDDDDEFIRTKILLLGTRRSGKTSVYQVLFENLKPKQAFFVEMTTRLTKHKVDSFIPLEIWDCPGNVTVESLGVSLSIFTTIIFVIDIQDSYHNPIARLIKFSITAFKENPRVNLEIFVHKAEALQEEYRNESFRHIQTRLLEELADRSPLSVNVPSSSSPTVSSPSEASFDPIQIPHMFHLTSIYDHSLHEAFSRAFTRILSPGSLPYLEELLNAFISTSSSNKAFLFDTKAKFFVATDSSPVDSVTLGLCCDYVHMLNQFGDLYKSAFASPTLHPRRRVLTSPASQSPSSAPSDASLPASPQSAKSRTEQGTRSSSGGTSRVTTPTHTDAASAEDASASLPGSSNSRSHSSTAAKVLDSEETAVSGSRKSTNRVKAVFHPSSSASLTPYTTLVFHAVTPRLALVALLPTTVWESKRGLVEYNIVFFREGVQEIFDLEQDTRRKKKRRAPDPTQSTLSRVASRK